MTEQMLGCFVSCSFPQAGVCLGIPSTCRKVVILVILHPTRGRKTRDSTRVKLSSIEVVACIVVASVVIVV